MFETNNCTCGYWDKDGKYTKEQTKHINGCPCTTYDNTPNVRILKALAGRF